MIIPSVYYLYRQSPDYGGMMQPAVNPNTFHWAGACASASLQTFRFSSGTPKASSSRLVAYWMNTSPYTRVVVVAINGDGSNFRFIKNVPIESSGAPRPISVDLTKEFNALIDAKVDTQVGYMVAGDTHRPPRFFVVKLEVDWELPVSE